MFIKMSLNWQQTQKHLKETLLTLNIWLVVEYSPFGINCIKVSQYE